MSVLTVYEPFFTLNNHYLLSMMMGLYVTFFSAYPRIAAFICDVIYEIKFQDFITKPRSILKFPKPVLMYCFL